MSDLPHETITLTVAMLNELQACKHGLRRALPFLPAVISTDPLDNLELAEELVEGDVPDTWWLMEKSFGEPTTVPTFVESAELNNFSIPCFNFRSDVREPYIVAQYLAIVADNFLTQARIRHG